MNLRECLYKTIHRNHKPLKLIAMEVDMSENYLTRSALPDPEDSDTGTGCRFPLKKLIPLIRSTGDFSVLDCIEQSLGRVAFLLPPPSRNLPDVYRLTMVSVREFGELMAEVEKAVSDGSISQSELGRIQEEGYEAIAAVVTLLKSLEFSK
jgi:hypothetical protein